jgi:hypothetical protein
MRGLHENFKRSSDPRVQVTSTIWGYATGMLALCIPLVSLSKGAAMIPLAVTLGAGAGTVAV